MRIAMIIQNFHPVIGGAEKQALTLSIALQSIGDHVVVLTRRQPTCPQKQIIEGVPVLRLFAWGPSLVNVFFFSISLAVHLLFNARAYDVFHIHLASSHALVPAIFGRILKKRVVIKIGGGDQIGEMALSRQTALGRFKLRVLAWSRPTIVVVNPKQVKELQASGLDHLNIVHIPNGVDLKRYAPANDDRRRTLREQAGWSGPIFLFVGRFADDKLRPDIFDKFIESWANITKSHPDLLFVMVGQGPLEKKYREIISKHEAEASVRVMPATGDVAPLYQAADVFVLPSITEGLSNALLEAMASGLPVLGSRVPGVVDIVEDGRHGCLFDPFSVAEIGTAIRKMAENKNSLVYFRPDLRKKAESFGIDSCARLYFNLYRRANTN